MNDIDSPRPEKRLKTASGSITRQVLAAVIGEEGQVVRISDLIEKPAILVREMRASITNAHKKEEPPYARCACCDQPVFIAFASRNRGAETSPYFKHYGDAGKTCPWTTDKPDDPRAVRVRQYEGRQKSERHDKLTTYLEQALLADSRVSHVEVEKYHYPKQHQKGHGRFPDVFAILEDGTEFAFEVQLSGSFMPEIVERQNYYLKEGVSLVWLFDGEQIEDPGQSFKDIIPAHSLDAFFFDETCMRISENSKRFTLKRRAWRREKFEARPDFSFQDFKILPGVLPFVEDGLTEEIKQNARRIRQPIIDMYEKHGPLRNAFGKFEPYALFSVDHLENCSHENKTPWDLVSLCSLILTIARAATSNVLQGHGFINYDSNEKTLQATINSWLSASSRKQYAHSISDAVEFFKLGNQLPASTQRKLQEAKNETGGIPRTGAEWKILEDFFPEIYDMPARQALLLRSQS